MTAARFIIKRGTNRFLIKSVGGGRPGVKGDRGSSAIPGVEFGGEAIEGGDLTFTATTNWGINGQGDPYFNENPDEIPVDERAWPIRFDPRDGGHLILATAAEFADAGGGDPELALDLAAHVGATTGVHGISDTSLLATLQQVAAQIDIHNQDSTDVHGIPDTADLETQYGAQAKVDTHAGDTTDVHGIPDTAALVTNAGVQAAIGAHAGDSTDVHGVPDMTQLATRSYVDSATAGGRPHDPVELVATTNIGLSGLGALDGATPSSGWRILAAGQTDPTANGLYIAGSGSWTRAADLDSSSELLSGITVYVRQGTHANTEWMLTFSGTPTLGTTAQTWTQKGSGAIPADADPATPSLRSLDNGPNSALSATNEAVTNQREPTDASVTDAKVAENADIDPWKVDDLVPMLDGKAPTIPRRWDPLFEPGVGGYNTVVRASRTDPQFIVAGGDELGLAIWNGRLGRWFTPRGLTNNEINDVVRHPRQPNVWWVATMGGVFRSFDGLNYAPQNAGLPTTGQEYFRAVGKILFDPTNDAHAYAFMGSHRPWKTSPNDVSNFGDVYETFNANDPTPTWAFSATIAPKAVIMGAAISANGTTMLAAIWYPRWSSTTTYSSGELAYLNGVVYSSLVSSNLNHSPDVSPTFWSVLTTHSLGLYRWTSGSGTWNGPGGFTGLPDPLDVRDVGADPLDPNVFHLTAEEEGGVGGGVFNTDDAGLAWTAATGLPSSPTDGYRKLDISPDGQTVVVSSRTTDKVHISSDQAASFTDFLTTADLNAIVRGNPAGAGGGDGLAIDPNDSTRVIVGTSDEIYEVTSSGVRSLGIRQLSGGRLRGRGFTGYVGEQVHFSKFRKNVLTLHAFDAGNTMFTDDLEGFTFPTRAIQPDSTSAGTLYGGAYFSAEGGPNGNIRMAILGQSGTFRGIAISTDYGKTYPVRVAGAAAGLPEYGSTLGSVGRAAIGCLDSLGQVWIALIGGKSYRTTNTGTGWAIVGDQTKRFETLAIDESTRTAAGLTTTIYMGDPSTGAGAWKSTDSGSTEALIAGTPHADSTSGKVHVSFCQITRRLYVTIWQPTSSIASAQQGTWRLTGVLWSRLFNDFCAKGAEPAPYDPNVIAVWTHDSPRRDVNRATGVWLTADDGGKFRQEVNNLPVRNVRALDWDRFEAGRVVIATEGRGFWTTTFDTTDLTAATASMPDDTFAQSQVSGLVQALLTKADSAEAKPHVRRPPLTHAGDHRLGGPSELPELWGRVPVLLTANETIDPVRHLGKGFASNSSSALTLTVELTKNYPVPVGASFRLHRRGSGTFTVQPVSGVTLINNGSPVASLSLPGVGDVYELWQELDNEWVIYKVSA